ncbi:MAG: hypothetical protein AAGK98_06080 [Pseudomonadota bacterium]
MAAQRALQLRLYLSKYLKLFSHYFSQFLPSQLSKTSGRVFVGAHFGVLEGKMITQDVLMVRRIESPFPVSCGQLRRAD